MISVKILADSKAPCGARLTTVEATYPLIIHNEICTHKMLSKSAASSRAIPVVKMIERVQQDPFTPVHIGANQKGMQAGDELKEEKRQHALDLWNSARENAVGFAAAMNSLGVHKQVVNRLLNPFQWMTTIISATEMTNFFGLRNHTAAEPHLQELARIWQEAYAASSPKQLREGEWHLPLVFDEDRDAAMELANETAEDPTRILIKVSAGRCARVSYLTHDGRRDIEEDIRLHNDLLTNQPIHASPAEHIGQALDMPYWYKKLTYAHSNVQDLRNEVVVARRLAWDAYRPHERELLNEAALGQLQSGNFYGFRQYRKLLENENIGGLMP